VPKRSAVTADSGSVPGGNVAAVPAGGRGERERGIGGGPGRCAPGRHCAATPLAMPGAARAGAAVRANPKLTNAATVARWIWACDLSVDGSDVRPERAGELFPDFQL